MISQRPRAAAMALAVAATLFGPAAHYARASTLECPTFDLAGAPCTTIDNWGELKAAAASSDGETRLCPFAISKPVGGDPIVLKKDATFICARGTASDECLIDGPGMHVQVKGRNARVTFHGFSFHGATDGSIRIRSAATAPHLFCECKFIRNRMEGPKWSKGGALRLDPTTTVHIEDSVFHENYGVRGGGIYNNANALTIVRTAFDANEAKTGGAIMTTEEASINLVDSNFANNIGAKGSAIFATGGNMEIMDRGGNIGNNNRDAGGLCDGFYDSTTRECVDFANDQQNNESSTSVSFYAIGDTPYTDAEFPLLLDHIQGVPADADFVVHLGDIKNGLAACTEERFQAVAGLLNASNVPVFIIPGDNEHNDCESPDEAWSIWKRTFGAFDSMYWQHNFAVTRMPGREENFAFIHRSVLFVGLNIVGGVVHDQDEWDLRLTEQFFFLKHLIDDNLADINAVTIFGHAHSPSRDKRFFDPLKEYLSGGMVSTLPVLYLQADRHRFTHKKPMMDLRNMEKIVIEGGAAEPPLKVMVDPTSGFSFDRQLQSLASNRFLQRLSEQITFEPGDLSNKDSSSGLLLSRGLSVRVLAMTGAKVNLTSQHTNLTESELPFHLEPDGAAVFQINNTTGGWIYVSNSEANEYGMGGVYALTFDHDGEPVGYSKLMGGTTRNCAGGTTPWDSWVSCEEHSKGHCWQVDAFGKKEPEKTKLVDRNGGNFESMAYDNRNTSEPVYFVTEDHPRGALRRYRPHKDSGEGWSNLHRKEGTLDYLQFLPDGTFTWTPSRKEGRRSAKKYYPNAEGIDHYGNGLLFFVSKSQRRLFSLDLDKGIYSSEVTGDGLFGKGSFQSQPDQIVRAPRTMGKYLFLTEDGGRSPGVYTRDVESGEYRTVFQAWDQSKFQGDETTGLAFSPDKTRMYACIQTAGILFEVTRDDQKPFDGSTLSLKHHPNSA